MTVWCSASRSNTGRQVSELSPMPWTRSERGAGARLHIGTPVAVDRDVAHDEGALAAHARPKTDIGRVDGGRTGRRTGGRLRVVAPHRLHRHRLVHAGLRSGAVRRAPPAALTLRIARVAAMSRA